MFVYQPKYRDTGTARPMTALSPPYDETTAQIGESVERQEAVVTHPAPGLPRGGSPSRISPGYGGRVRVRRLDQAGPTPCPNRRRAKGSSCSSRAFTTAPK
jgi:hypothetical protein